MITAAKLNGQRKAAGLPLIRFNIRNLGDQDIQDLRDAYQALFDISDASPGDRRGYWGTARGHGYDLDLCHNDSRIFLTWHRAYVYSFEKALNAAFKAKRGAQDLELTLPYWDWTVFNPDTDNANGIPNVINDPTYTNAEGVTVKNPLQSARSMYRTQSQGLTGDDEWTRRFPARFRNGISELADDVRGYMELSNYMTFSNSFNGGAHGDVHTWVGGRASAGDALGFGDMAQVVSAAYDPIFWLHHCMVDKVWFDWQGKHGDATVPEHVRSTVVYGDFTGEYVLDAESNLRYTFSDSVVGSMIADLDTVDADIGSGMTLNLPVGNVAAGFDHARVDFHSLKPPINPYRVQIYINKPDADGNTTRDDAAYAGRLSLFGHGRCHGAPGHCNPDWEQRDDYDLRRKHPLRSKKTTYSVDISKALRDYVAKADDSSGVNLCFVVTDINGDQVKYDALDFSGVTVTTS